MTPVPRVVIVGGGITGLSLAHALEEEARAAGRLVDVVVLEAGEPGGHAQTSIQDGFLVERGPNGFLDREPETLALVRELGLESRMVQARPEARRRFIVRDGQLCRAPDSPPALLRTRALSVPGKLRLLLEPFAGAPPVGVDETVYDFALRRIGAEAAEMLVDTAVAGISAGDSRALSVAAQFPLMVEMEREHGSLIRAMLARRRRRTGRRGPSRLFSFDRGLSTLVSSLTGRLGSGVHTQTRVEGLARAGSRWRVATDRGDTIHADRVVLAVSSRAASAIVQPVDAELSMLLSRIPFSGLTVAGLAYRVADVPRPLDGYGYLVTRRERMATLGVVWESSLFPGRAPEGMVLLRAFLGGARRPDLASIDATGALALARQELGQVLGISAAPARTWTFHWPAAIAQYTVGHLDRVAAIRARLLQHGGLTVCGTSYDGTSFNQAIAAGRRAGRALAADLAAPADRASQIPHEPTSRAVNW
jgi:oxygen-dependent protoporphyrinogen oxidase